METIGALVLIAGVITLLYITGRETLITWGREADGIEYDPTFKETVIFIILYMTAQKAVMDAFKRKE